MYLKTGYHDLWDISIFKITLIFHVCIANAVYRDIRSYCDINCGDIA